MKMYVIATAKRFYNALAILVNDYVTSRTKKVAVQGYKHGGLR